jgi:hypothetical protein
LLGRRTYGGQPRRRSVFWPFVSALILGALSMTIPVSGTFTLQGTLSANTEPAAAEPAQAGPAAPQLPEGAAGRALVFAAPAECPWVQLNEPSIVTIDVPSQTDLVLSASILSIEARAPALLDSAAQKRPPWRCRVELALIAEAEESTVLRGLPLGAAARADFPTTRSWLGAIVAQVPTDSREALEKASAGFRGLSGLVRQLYRTYIAPRLH